MGLTKSPAPQGGLLPPGGATASFTVSAAGQRQPSTRKAVAGLQDDRSSRQPDPQAWPAQPPSEELIRRVGRGLASRRASIAASAGTLLFGCIAWAAGAAPCLLPHLYVAAMALALPARVGRFGSGKLAFFLADFCYWANAAALLHLLITPTWQQGGAAVAALCDGPVAGALIVWACPWRMESAAHQISVLIHLLPGMALAAHRHYGCGLPLPQLLAAWWSGGRVCPDCPPGYSANQAVCGDVRALGLWLLAWPLAFYIVWQAAYWVLVQCACRTFILHHGYDTSYRELARSMQGKGSWAHDWVRRGRPARRVAAYGALQLAFTCTTLLLAVATFCFPWAAVTWQLVKVAVPVFFGAVCTHEVAPAKYFAMGVLALHTATQGSSNEVADNPQQHCQAVGADKGGGRRRSTAGHGPRRQ